MMQLTDRERKVLTVLQRGIALVEQPFRGLVLPESEVVELLQRALATGLIRRFGGVFDSRQLGYKSMLCAVDAAADSIDDIAAVVCRHPGVTHCYERQALIQGRQYPSLWFTIALAEQQFPPELEALRAQLAGAELLTLPAVQRFKVDVVFDLRATAAAEPAAEAFVRSEKTPTTYLLSALECKIVRLLAAQMPICTRPFAAVAHELAIETYVLLETLQRWQNQGMLRRIAPILHHRRAGFTCNGMCVWPVDGDIAAVAAELAASPEVTHCYQRPRLPAFPFDLFAMIHTGSRQALIQVFTDLSAACGLTSGNVLISTHEYKKTSMPYDQITDKQTLSG